MFFILIIKCYFKTHTTKTCLFTYLKLKRILFLKISPFIDSNLVPNDAIISVQYRNFSIKYLKKLNHLIANSKGINMKQLLSNLEFVHTASAKQTTAFEKY